MTLILATPTALYGDRRISSSDGTRAEPIRKIAGNQILVAGFSGEWSRILRSVEAVESGETDPKQIAKIGADGLIVVGGRMLLIDGGRVKTRPKRDKFYCTGSGWQEGMAHLAGQIAAGKKVTDKSIRATFRYCFRVRVDCGGPIDFLPG